MLGPSVCSEHVSPPAPASGHQVGAPVVLPPLSALPVQMGPCSPPRAPGWAQLCANVVVFDSHRAITAAGHGGTGPRVTVPRWPCTAQDSTMRGEHGPSRHPGRVGSSISSHWAVLELSGAVLRGAWGIQIGAMQCLASPPHP